MMINKNAAFKLFINLICSFGVINSAFAEVYIVKKGESLSTILYKKSLKPIYGKNGTLIKIIGLNKKLQKRGPDFVYPGMKIVLIDQDLVLEKEQSTAVEKTQHLEPVLIESSPEKIAEVKVEKKTEKKNEEPVSSPPSSPVENKERVVASNANNSYKDDEQYFYVRMLPQVSWMKVTANSNSIYNSSNLSALSKANLGILGNYGINVSKNLNIYGFSYFSQVNFYDEPRLTVDRKHFLRSSYGLGFDYSINDSWKTTLRLGYFDEFYLDVPSLNTVNVFIVQTPEAHWGVRHSLGGVGNVYFDTGIFGKIILPQEAGGVDGKLGYGIGGDFLVRFKSKGLRFFYNVGQAHASGKDTSTFELGWNLVFEGRFYE